MGTTLAERVKAKIKAGEFKDDALESARIISEGEDGHYVNTGLNFRIPSSWPKLPETAAIKEEVNWIGGNYSRVIRIRDGKKNVIELSRALRPVPSERTLAFLQQAASNPGWFFKDFMPRIIMNGEEDPEKIAEDGAAVAEIEEMLVALRRRARERMEAGT